MHTDISVQTGERVFLFTIRVPRFRFCVSGSEVLIPVV